MKYPFIAIILRSTWAAVIASDRVESMGSLELLEDLIAGKQKLYYLYYIEVRGTIWLHAYERTVLKEIISVK